MNSQASSTPQPPPPRGVVNPNHGTTPAGYRPAIQPETTLAQSNSLPTFTSADVEKYLQTDEVAREASSLHLTTTITFVSSQNLGTKLNDDFSVNAPILCYVEFSGNQPFTLNAVRTPAGVAAPQFTKVYEVFDGQTGDLITWGGLR